MNTRRRFLQALGMGGLILGVPGVAHAFGRRRRHSCCSCSCPVVSCPSCGAQRLPPYQALTCTRACPIQYYGQSNGVFYYYCECCTNGSFTDYINASYTDYIECPQHCADSMATCIPVPATGDPGITLAERHKANAPDVPHCIFTTQHHLNGVVFINDAHNPNKDPTLFFDEPHGVRENSGKGTDVRYDTNPPNMIYAYARIHEIEIIGKHYLRIAHPYDPNQPTGFPASFKDADFKKRLEKHDVIEYGGNRYHVHRTKKG